MSWLAVNKDGSESIYQYKPNRGNSCWNPNLIVEEMILPRGSIKKLIGKNLTWKDNPVELKEE